MSYIAQRALQNDLFVAGGLAYFLNLPFFQPYWNPAIPSGPLPEQSQITLRPEATITQTVTVLPEPTTLSPTQTVYDTVTKNVTSISTVVHQQLVTKRRCLPTDPDAPRATLVTYSEVWEPRQTYARCVPCAPMPSTKPSTQIISTCSTVWTAWVPLSLFIITLGVMFLAFRLDLISMRVAKAEETARRVTLALEAEKKVHQECRTKACNYVTELGTSQRKVQDLLEGIARRNDMLKTLGVFKDDDEIVDEESLHQMVRERKAYLVIDANRIRRMETENAAQSKKIMELEADNASTKERVETLLSEIPTDETKRQFQLSLDDKDRTIQYWREAFLRNESDTTLKETQRLCEEKEVELQELRFLPAKIDELQRTLSDASNQIEVLQQEKKEQGIADRRRWNKEKEELREMHDKAIKALKADLKEAKELSALAVSADAAADKELLLNLKAEKEGLHIEVMNLQRQLCAVNKTVSGVQDSKMLKIERDKLKTECDELRTALHDQESRHVAERQQIFAEFSAERNNIIMEGLNLQQKQQIMNQNGSELVRDLKEIKEEREELGEEHEKLKVAMSKLESKYEAANEQYMDLKEQQNAQYMQTLTLEEQLRDANEELHNVREDLEDMRDERNELEDKLEEMQRKYQAVSKRFIDLKADQNQLHMEGMGIRMQLHAMNEAVAEAVQGDGQGDGQEDGQEDIQEDIQEDEEETDTESMMS